MNSIKERRDKFWSFVETQNKKNILHEGDLVEYIMYSSIKSFEDADCESRRRVGVITKVLIVHLGDSQLPCRKYKVLWALLPMEMGYKDTLTSWHWRRELRKIEEE